MKLLTALLLAFLLFTTFLFSQNTFRLGFTGAYPNYYHGTVNPPTYNSDWNWYDEFSMNTWSAWWVGDTAQTVFSRLNSHDMFGLFQPDTLRWAGYGRVVEYNAAKNSGRFYFKDKWCGTPVPDNGKTVMYYDVNSNCPPSSVSGIILRGVDENGIQSVNNFGYDPMYQVPFPGNDGNGGETRYINNLYIKPRIRISVTDAYSDPPKNVCLIIVKAYNGDVIKADTLKTSNFLNDLGQYNGEYIEDFYLHPITISADSLNRTRPSYHPQVLANCQIDYQVYWYGTVNVWIDYVKVMDEPANMLFTNQTLRDRLNDKIQRFKIFEQANDTVVKGFYMEEVDYSNLACLQYLNETLLPQWSGNDPDYKMIGLINWISFRGPLREGRATDYADFMDAVRPNAGENNSL